MKIKYSEMVSKLAKSGNSILKKLTPPQAHSLHMAVGISGEAGELLDAIKKSCIYQKPLDRENVIEELGDLEFYMEGLRQGYNITREETLEANIKKLSVRYKNLEYSDQAAQDRADKLKDYVAWEGEFGIIHAKESIPEEAIIPPPGKYAFRVEAISEEDAIKEAIEANFFQKPEKENL